MKRRKLDRLVYHLSLICFFGGVLLAIGSAGASDLGEIELSELIIRGGAGVILAGIGSIGLIRSGGFENEN